MNPMTNTPATLNKGWVCIGLEKCFPFGEVVFVGCENKAKAIVPTKKSPIQNGQ